ncbi:MAG: TolC family protein [Deferribacteraceae bacterium]|jgi:outer membrane protein TolC|nr:TolC family protein [Deferribacteraceae bacterium]
MKLFVILLLVPLFSATASALTMEEAINLTLQNDDSIKQQRSLTEAQGHTKRTAIAAFLPKADLSYEYIDAETRKPELESKTSTFGITAGFNLFNGLADINRYRLGSAALDMQEYSYEGKKQDVMLNVKTAYISYLKARNALEVAQQMLTLLETQKKIAEVSYNVGQFSRADVLRVDVQLASTQLELLNAQIAMKLARQQLERYIGRAIPNGEMVAEVSVATNYPIPTMDNLTGMMEDNRSEMRYVKRAFDSASIDRYVAGSEFLPKINLGYMYEWDGTDTNPFDGVEDVPNSPSSSIDGTSGFSVSMTWNVFKGFYDVSTVLSKARTTNAAAYAVSDLRKTLRLQLSDAYENYFSARERLSVAEVGVVQAEESYRVTQSQYENSEATTTDLLNASVALSQALTSRAGANYDIIAAVAQLERAVETEFLGYKIEDIDEE